MIGIDGYPLLRTATPVTPGGFAVRRRRLSKVDEVFGTLMKLFRLQHSPATQYYRNRGQNSLRVSKRKTLEQMWMETWSPTLDDGILTDSALLTMDEAHGPSAKEDPSLIGISDHSLIFQMPAHFLHEDGDPARLLDRDPTSNLEVDDQSTTSDQSAYLDLVQHFGFRLDDGLFDRTSSIDAEESEAESQIEDGADLTEELSDYLARRNTEEGRVRLLGQAILSTRLTQEDNDKLQNMPGAEIPEDTFISEFRIRQELRKQTNFAVKLIECCPNECMAFTWQFVEHSHCILCKRNRWSIDASGKRKPYQTFAYFPPTNRLRAMWRNKEACELLKYRDERTHDPDMMEDIFDGRHFANLRNSNVTWAGKEIMPPRRQRWR
ncbi:hypothetical protein QFC20_004725 [Naganishia adeliensis]|uniref:Uncharacterized protein n=1 Tax=Naganishia adeliensis TaxID=92952 RepID=A0ACC2VYK5_9TREE|nr:hypothetical protein QFC20_004725 [Naganishia adeliensis]